MRLDVRSQFHKSTDLVIGETGCVASVEAFSPHRAAARASLDDHTLIAETTFNDLAGSGRDDVLKLDDGARHLEVLGR